MRTKYRPPCHKRTRPDDTIQWARALVADPARYGADERTRQIVERLLAQIGAAR